MKKIAVILVVCLIMITNSLIAQIKVNSSGYVGINNTSPSYRLDVSGTVRMVSGSYTVLFSGASFYPYSGNMDLGSSGKNWYRFYATTAFLTYQPVIMSDVNFKLNVTNLSLMKDKLKLLRPVSYNLKPDFEGFKIDPKISNLQYGFIAQELQEVFPDMVSQRDDGVLGVRYTELIPVLVQALKEQQEEIEDLIKRVAELEQAGK
ncbi:MAG TPA: tail fiber domain-containing protein [Bacteroidales bacterium]|nr:tail fiber domain-containing protein [Bacteroidales bacterium]